MLLHLDTTFLPSHTTTRLSEPCPDHEPGQQWFLFIFTEFNFWCVCITASIVSVLLKFHPNKNTMLTQCILNAEAPRRRSHWHSLSMLLPHNSINLDGWAFTLGVQMAGPAGPALYFTEHTKVDLWAICRLFDIVFVLAFKDNLSFSYAWTSIRLGVISVVTPRRVYSERWDVQTIKN